MVRCDADRRAYDSHLWVRSEGRHSILTPPYDTFFFNIFFFLVLLFTYPIATNPLTKYSCLYSIDYLVSLFLAWKRIALALVI